MIANVLFLVFDDLLKPIIEITKPVADTKPKKSKKNLR